MSYIVKQDYSFCIHCKEEFHDDKIEETGCCPKCENDDFEEVKTDWWKSLSDEQKDDCFQNLEDHQVWHSQK